MVPTFKYYMPLLDLRSEMPKAYTPLSRESLSTGTGADKNPDCT